MEIFFKCHYYICYLQYVYHVYFFVLSNFTLRCVLPLDGELHAKFFFLHSLEKHVKQWGNGQFL